MRGVLRKVDFAARRRVTKSAVSRWIRYGFISGPALTEDGKMIVVAEVEKQLAARIDPGRGRPRRVDCPPRAAARRPRLAEWVANLERRLAAAIDQVDELTGEFERFILQDVPTRLELDAAAIGRLRDAWENFRRWTGRE